MGFDGAMENTDYWSSDSNSEGIVFCQCCVVDGCYLLGILSAKLMQIIKKSGFVNSCQTKKLVIFYSREAGKFCNFHYSQNLPKTDLSLLLEFIPCYVQKCIMKQSLCKYRGYFSDWEQHWDAFETHFPLKKSA